MSRPLNKLKEISIFSPDLELGRSDGGDLDLSVVASGSKSWVFLQGMRQAGADGQIARQRRYPRVWRQDKILSFALDDDQPWRAV